MIVFNELRIDSDKNLIIDASVLDIIDDPNRQVHIDQINVGIGSKCDSDLINFYVADYFGPNSMGTILDGTFENIRRFRLVIPETFFNTIKSTEDALKNLIYIQVGVDYGTIDISCSYVTSIEGYVYDKCLLMNSVFNYLKESNKDCGEVANLANYIAKIKGLELAIEGGNFELANKYWNKFFMNNSIGVSSSNCGCR